MSRLTSCVLLAATLSWAGAARPAEVVVHALAQGRATLSVDKGKARTLRVGEVHQGVKLISANTRSAVIEVEGKRRRVTMGEAVAASSPQPGTPQVILTADGQGHFFTTGTINGVSVRFLVDTGATMVSMDVEAARRAGIDYLRGERALSITANGVTPVYRVKLDSVRVGDITLTNVDGTVHENAALPVVLLGMSFLGRLEMRREADRMTLTKKY
ncbi:MAG TPA: TIGR02281 family clan AA aspartic protease [Burkholderiales bacterium]|jgi:aspartyl protease family protein|nr:TIGR02281 family clan AA aspartic protease [Burkholderiales bacterium]